MHERESGIYESRVECVCHFQQGDQIGFIENVILEKVLEGGNVCVMVVGMGETA